MNHIIKSLIIGLMAVYVSQPSLSEDQDNLQLTPEIPSGLTSGMLMKLDTELGYHPPKPIHRSPPIYPIRQRKKTQEGMVVVKFMVDEEGKVFEPIVIESTHSAFEGPALDAVLKYQYEAAHIDGKPLKSVTSIRLVFSMQDSEDAAGRKFISIYKKADKGMSAENPDQQELRRDLDRLANAKYLTNYGLAYLSMLEYRYATKFLSKQEQLKSLRKLLLFQNRIEKDRQFLDEAAIRSIRMNILQLLIELGYYGEARSNFYWLNKEIPSAAEPFNDAMTQVREILGGDDAIMRSVELSDRGYEYHDLTKRSFEIDIVEGGIEKLNFYCTRSFGTMAFSPDSSYRVPESWGACDLLVVGRPKTKAKLYQF
jgi:TonB family protein